MSLFPVAQDPMFVEAGYGINDGRVTLYKLECICAIDFFSMKTCIIEYVPDIDSSPSRFAFPAHSRSKIQLFTTLRLG